MRLGSVARRAALLSWLRERPAHQGLSAGEIARVSGLYDWMQQPRCGATSDLYALGRRVRWEWAIRSSHRARVWYPSEAVEW